MLLTAVIGTLTSYLSNLVSLVLKPFALPLAIIVLVISFLTVWLYFLQTDSDRPAPASGGVLFIPRDIVNFS